MKIIKYKHHNEELMAVVEAMKGKHKEHCLCFMGCENFKPDPSGNCEIAQAVYENCVKFNIVTPMWECPNFSGEQG